MNNIFFEKPTQNRHVGHIIQYTGALSPQMHERYYHHGNSTTLKEDVVDSVAKGQCQR